MAASSNTAGQPKHGLGNASDGLRSVVAAPEQQVSPILHALRIAPPTYAASGQPVYPTISAFDGLIIDPTESSSGMKHPPVPASISAESSSGLKHPPYDVFINHHGGDTKQTVANAIYKKLDAIGLRVFLDKDELMLGDFFPEALQEAMASASLHIAIFSEHYAESPWCLAELAFMLQTGIKFIPIFYRVEPYILRWAIKEKGIYAAAFSKDEMKSRHTTEKLHSWKWALHKASFYTGEIINNQGEEQEQEAVKKVVNRVLQELNKVPLDVAKHQVLLDVAEHSVGLDEAVQDFEEFALQSAESIKIVGIHGMGGAGKTTLAKQFYNKKCSTIRSSFLFDLREAAKKGLLHEKQKMLLKELDLKGKGVDFDNVDKGKEILKNGLKSVSVLIVLDDVDHIDQLHALLPVKESLGPGSLIIVTTRELQVLKNWGISAIYKIRALNAAHAEELFCSHAFQQLSPLSGFEDLAKKFINACHGLPLSLKVLGSQLYGEFSKNYWQSQLDKLSRMVPDDIKLRLKISYDALDKEEKEMFLDIACFFIGSTSSEVIAVWDGSEWNGLHGWQRLVNKCLVELDENNLIRMHDHLRDLGREIANQQSPHRLWSKSQIIEIHPQQEAIRIRGMVVHAIGKNCYPQQGKILIHTSQGERSLAPHSLGLKIFVGNGDFINQEYSELSRELLWLECNDFQHKNLPSWLPLKNLRILKLSSSQIYKYLQDLQDLQDLWEHDEDAPLQLTELKIQRCGRLRGFPKSIGDLRNLKKIIIGDCVSYDRLSGLPQEFCYLQSLEHLEMNSCTNLTSLPSNFGELTNLQHLSLDGCRGLEMLPDSFEKLILLEYLNLVCCQELTIKARVFENMTKLRYLNLGGCWKLEELRLPEVASLTELNLLVTGLKEVPANISQQTKLTELKIGSDELTTLPTSLGNLSSLTTLEIWSCPKLESLPDSLEHLNFLRDLAISNSGVKCLPKSFIHLQSLTIAYTPISELSFGSGCMLKTIRLEGTKVSKISISGDCCPFLETLELRYNKDLRELETLPATLKSLHVNNCKVLKDIRGVRGLKNLNNLFISYCEELGGLPFLAQLTSLKEFKLIKFHKLGKIKGLESLTSLQTLKIDDCSELDGLPSLAELTSLKKFKLIKCHKLGKIKGLESLTSLQTLTIDDCSELDGLPSLAKLTSLEEFKLKECHKLEKIEGLEQLTSLEMLEVLGFWKAPCIVRLEDCERLKRLVIVANDRVVVEPFRQKWPEEVIICTRALIDVGSLNNFFTSFPLKSEGESGSDIYLRRPQSSPNANAILICFIIDYVYTNAKLHIYMDRGNNFETELANGKWQWIGVFQQGSDWLQSNRYNICTHSEDENEADSEDEIVGVKEAYSTDKDVKVKDAWLVMGEEGSILEAFHRLSQSCLVPSTVSTPHLCTSYNQLCYGLDQTAPNSAAHATSDDNGSFYNFLIAEDHPTDHST